MNKIWCIKLYEDENGYEVVIENEILSDGYREYNKVTGKASTPHEAYRTAVCELEVKPWFTSVDENNPVPSPGIEETETIKYYRADELKSLATDFFHWWHNQPGTNTQDGFDEWMKTRT